MSSSCPIAPTLPSGLHLNTLSLKSGSKLTRCHKIDPKNSYPANSFNPNTGKHINFPEQGARFNPFPGAPAANIPTLYAADNLKAAVLESIFHELPHKPYERFAEIQLEEWGYSELQITRDLTLFKLVNPELKPLVIPGRDSITEEELIHTLPAEYPHTRTWACEIHKVMPNLDGLAWRPRLGGEGESYVFFGDRFKAGDLIALGKAIPAAHGPGLTEVKAIASASYIDLFKP